MDRRSLLARDGWVPTGNIMYYVNGVSQAMTKGHVPLSELERAQSLGSTQPRILVHRFGGEGAMGKYYE